MHSSFSFSWFTILVNVNSILLLLFKNFGVILYSFLFLTPYFLSLRKLFWLCFQNKSRIWSLFITSTTTNLAHATIFSDLDNCNSLFNLPLPPSAFSQNSSHSDTAKTHGRSFHTLALLMFFLLSPGSCVVLSLNSCISDLLLSNKWSEHSSLNNTHLLFKASVS